MDRISILLQEFNIEKIMHIKGQHNCLADYLSRRPIQNDEEIFDEDYGISMLFQWEPLETVHVPVNHPPFIGAVVTRSKMKQIKQQQNENDKITLPTWSFWHSMNVFKKLKNKFWWPNMKQSIIQHIQSCLPCQQHNISRTKKLGRLNPIPTTEGPFQLIGIDYCGPFKPTPHGNQYVLCITDY
ncbi:unnamed protein product, partial [Rotaria sordida]